MPRADNKGYGNSQVLMRDYTTLEDCETVLSEIADQVGTRLRKNKALGEVVGISIGFAEPDEHNKNGFGAQTRIDPTNSTDDLVRNVGVRVNRISKPSSLQISLFEPAPKHEANAKLEQVLVQS